MESIGQTYYKLNRNLLALIGLWNVKTTWLNLSYTIFCSVILILGFFMVGLAVFTIPFSSSMFSRTLICTIADMTALLKYLTFFINNKKIREIFDHIDFDWKTLKNEEEISILREFTLYGTRLRLLFALCVFPTPIFTIASQFLPDFLDIVAPLNESRPHTLPMKVIHVIDVEKNYLFTFLQIDITALLMVTSIVATETTLIMFVQHFCGLNKILSRRIMRAVNNYSYNNGDCQSKSETDSLCSAILFHQRIFQLLEKLNSAFGLSYFFLLGVAVLAISVTHYQFAHGLALGENLTELADAFFFSICQLNYAFMLNHVCQQSIDSQTDIFKSLCDAMWYSVPLHVQKTLIFMMQRTVKESHLELGGVYIPSHEGFTMLYSTSMSYFMFIRSMQAQSE